VAAGAGNKLTPTKAYTSLALFTLLRFPLAFLPSVIFAVINALVALNRIGQFLQSSEVDDNDPGFVTQGALKKKILKRKVNLQVFSCFLRKIDSSRAA
jgi:hypothetical protein